jgi:hypothetical protein
MKVTNTTTARLPQINIIAGISNRNRLFFSINKGTNNSTTFLNFLLQLSLHLDNTQPAWRDCTIIMIDNAPYHRSRDLAKQIKELSLPMFFLGPYQFNLAPVEKFFNVLKSQDLNLLKTATTPKYIILTQSKLYRRHLQELMREMAVVIS